MDNKPQDEVFHSIDKKTDILFTPGIIILFLMLVLGGIGTGYVLSRKGVIGKISSSATVGTGSSLQKGVVYGSTDTQTFKDMAQGVVQVGGIDGEGQYHLVRPGGASQYVYMTSSLVDLSKFVGHKVQVWGQTQAAQHAGWLMDVGRVEVSQ